MKDRSDDLSHHERELLPYGATSRATYMDHTHAWIVQCSTIRLTKVEILCRRKDVLINVAVNTFYLRLNMVKDHFMGYSYRLKRRVLFYMYYSTDRIVHTSNFVTPAVEHWLELEIPRLVNQEESISQLSAPRANALFPSYVPVPQYFK